MYTFVLKSANIPKPKSFPGRNFNSLSRKISQGAKFANTSMLDTT